MGTLSFVPAVAGFWIGILFLLTLDHLIPHLHVGSDQAEAFLLKNQSTKVSNDAAGDRNREKSESFPCHKDAGN